MLFEIAVRSPLRKLFTYESETPLPKGARVRVPFRNREVIGFVWRETKNSPKGLKKILECCDQESFFDDRTLEFYERSAEYYGISLGDLLSSALPKKVREGAPLIDLPPKVFAPALPELSELQKKVVQEISATQGFKTHLLQGEMGSGKTEVYLKLAEKVLEQGGQVLFLVPEIALTPQLEDRLASRLGTRVTVFHSQQTEKKRYEAFARAWLGQSDIILGARSALFLPFKNLKLLIVDEEHDHSYKQAERGAYHARDLSILRAQIFQIPVVLGSATPSLETLQRSKNAESPIYELPPFYPAPKTEMKVIDLKKIWKETEKSFICPDLHEMLVETLEKKEQSLLFLNRRGSASQRVCLGCGAVDECKNCSVTLTIHHDLKMAICHWCGFQKPLQKKCDQCQSDQFFLGGIGTKEVEAQIRARFPEASIARVDRDQATKKNAFEDTIRDFASGKIDILIGTQMISKGIDIPKLSTVGVLLADYGWGMPDFRAAERSFQLLRQLMGRAGRRGQSSRFLVQTFSPDNSIFDWLRADKPFEQMAESELAIRKMANLPPFSKLALWTLSHKSEAVVERAAQKFLERFQKLAANASVQLIGPAPAPVAKWKGVYRMHLLCKASPKAQMTGFLTAVLDDLEKNTSDVKVRLDRDPYQFM